MVELILDLSSDLGETLTARFYYHSGLKLARTVYGSASPITLDWQKKFAKHK